MRVLIEFEKNSLLFKDSHRVISCYEPTQLKASFDEMEKCLKAGYHLAGFISYEAGYGFEEKLAQLHRGNFPLIYLGCFDGPVSSKAVLSGEGESFTIKNVSANISKDSYFQNIERIRHYIQAGDVYQITYCLKLLFSFSGSAYGLYRRLLVAQPIPYPAYLDTGQYQILSLSPEMFMKKKKDFIITKPMKGSWPRGSRIINGLFDGLRLKYSEKNRAENVMIADLLRNDLGRVACRVRAPKLYEVAKYRTIYQMTSTVTAKIDKEVNLYNLFAALFPSGSVTGAPKIRAMEIIHEVEPQERKIYTGAIGFITPQKDLFFNIPIRTVLLEGKSGEMGIGGGIVWDSTAEGEWQEGLWKTRFFTDLAAGSRPAV